MDLNDSENTIKQLEREIQSLKNKLYKWEQKAASYEGIEDDRYKLEQMNLRLTDEIKQL